MNVDAASNRGIVERLGAERARVIAGRLAEVIDACDHLVVKDSADDPDDEMVAYTVSAQDTALIVVALLDYAKAP